MKSHSHSGRVALITGAGGGLGRAFVREFLAQDWTVVAACHSSPADFPVEPSAVLRFDVSSRLGVRAATKTIVEKFGRIDLLINNAGITADGSSWQITDEAWAKVFNVNLKGAFLCSQAVLPSMLAQRDGQIINISSFAARRGHRGQASYVAAKAGLIGLTESLAWEAGPQNVRVNAILPGILPTPMTAQLTGDQLKELAGENALGRINELEEVARFAAFLATLKNVSGQIFQLDSRIARWT